MCFKKWFPEWFSKPDNPVYSKKILLTYAINDYMGSENDLNGCLFDQQNIINNLSDFQIREYKDYNVTRVNFINGIDIAITFSQPGDTIVIHYSGHGTYVKDRSGDEPDGYDEALYLYDGDLIDDDIRKILDKTPQGVTVVVLLDSCFSESATRKLNKAPNRHHGRFLRPKETPQLKKLHKGFLKEEIKWIAFSACKENQTSADAYFTDHYEGAFTHYAMKTLDRNLTYKQWYDKIRTYLPSAEFNQIPMLEGPEELINKKVFT